MLITKIIPKKNKSNSFGVCHEIRRIFQSLQGYSENHFSFLGSYHDKCVSTSMIFLMLFTLKWTRKPYYLETYLVYKAQGLHSPFTWHHTSRRKPSLHKHMKHGKFYTLYTTDVWDWKPTQKHTKIDSPKGLFISNVTNSQWLCRVFICLHHLFMTIPINSNTNIYWYHSNGLLFFFFSWNSSIRLSLHDLFYLICPWFSKLYVSCIFDDLYIFFLHISMSNLEKTLTINLVRIDLIHFMHYFDATIVINCGRCGMWFYWFYLAITPFDQWP